MRLKAYTLIEMLVVLVLSAIVVVIAYSVYSQFRLFSMEYEKRTQDSSEFLAFDQHVRHDARRASNIEANSEGFMFFEENHELFSGYSINAAGIQRKQNSISDMFNINILSIRLDSSLHKKMLILEIDVGAEKVDTFQYNIQLKPHAQSQSSQTQ